MGLILNNTSFVLTGGSFVSSEPIPPIPPVGQIFRVVNVLTVDSDSFSYTKIDGSTASTATLSPGSITYILALSGSLFDSVWNGNDWLNSFAVSNLLITSSVDITPTFTEQLITTTGAGTWTKPVGVTEVIVECWGGGGAGGGATTNGQLGSGGAGGSFVRKLVNYTSPSAGKSYSVAASVAGTTGNGANGNDTTWETSVAVAKGGGGGLANDLNGSGGGLPLTPSVGDVIREGSLGGNAFTTRGGDISGAGGGGAGSVTIFTPAYEFGGAGGESVGVGGAGADINGIPGSNYGGGGSGGDRGSAPSKLGGSGAQGLIRLIYR